MLKKILLATVTTVFLVLSAGASADMVANVYSCTLKEGKTSEDAHAVNGEWLKWARAQAGTDGIRSSYTTAIVGESAWRWRAARARSAWSNCWYSGRRWV